MYHKRIFKTLMVFILAFFFREKISTAEGSITLLGYYTKNKNSMKIISLPVSQNIIFKNEKRTEGSK